MFTSLVINAATVYGTYTQLSRHVSLKARVKKYTHRYLFIDLMKKIFFEFNVMTVLVYPI